MTYKGVIICNWHYPADPLELPSLKGPRRDFLMMWSALTDGKFGIFSPENLAVLVEQEGGEVLEAVDELFGEADEADVCLLYFSGHGRRLGQELVLCTRNTVTSKLASTGVTSGVVNSIIENSNVGNVVIILDCCHSGAFKGDDIVVPFEGSGRFIFAASRSSELTPDAKALGQPSPFTAAVAEALRGGAHYNEDGAIDVEDVFRYASSRPVGARPQKRFSGTGSLVMARQHGEESTLPETRQAADVVTSARGSPIFPSGTVSSLMARAFSGRSQYDYSLGDFRLWLFQLVLAVWATVTSVPSYYNWPVVQDPSGALRGEAERAIARGATALGVGFTLVAVIEGIILHANRRKIRTRRELLEVLEKPAFTRLRLAKAILSVLSILAVFSPLLTGFENYRQEWTMTLAGLAVLAVSSSVAAARYGDAALLSSGLVLLVSAFLPSAESSSSIGSATGPRMFPLILAVGVLTAWWLKANRRFLALYACVIALSFLPLLYDNGIAFGTWTSVCAGVYVALAVLVGCGRQVSVTEPGGGGLGVVSQTRRPSVG